MEHLYNSKMTIQSLSRSQDEYGTWTETWTNVPGLIDIPCRINWLSGFGRGEHVIAGKITWTRDAKVYCNYYSNITTKMRMVYNEENYDIIDFADVDEKGQYMILSVKREE